MSTADTGVTAARVTRLMQAPRPLPMAARVAALVGALALVLVPTALLLVPDLVRVPGS
jgi:hypothetical protein